MTSADYEHTSLYVGGAEPASRPLLLPFTLVIKRDLGAGCQVRAYRTLPSLRSCSWNSCFPLAVTRKRYWV